jgi:hypothetical protein
MDKAFKIGLLVGIFGVVFALLQQSQNGRYRYSTNGGRGVVVDTRTGEFWQEDGSHFEPRMARITARHPSMDDQTENDDKTNKFKECLDANVRAIRDHSTVQRDCVAEMKVDFQPRPEPPKADAAKE